MSCKETIEQVIVSLLDHLCSLTAFSILKGSLGVKLQLFSNTIDWKALAIRQFFFASITAVLAGEAWFFWGFGVCSYIDRSSPFLRFTLSTFNLNIS